MTNSSNERLFVVYCMQHFIYEDNAGKQGKHKCLIRPNKDEENW